MNSRLVSLALALAVPSALGSTALAQDCTEDAADGRYCGVDLIGGRDASILGGPAGYGESGHCLGPNDDGSSEAIDITSAFPAGLNFFGSTYTSLYLNTNGNITFSGPVGTYTPNPFPVSSQPMIAPYWADVDIRGSACSGYCGTACLASCANPTDNGVWYDLTPGQAVFTWDNTGYFSCSNTRLMSFQLILRTATGCGSSSTGGTDFSVEFRYNKCQWTTGNASSGTGGLSTLMTTPASCTVDSDCGTYQVRCDGGRCYRGIPGQAGFDAGNDTDYVMIPGSRTNDISRLLCDDSNVGEPGVWRFLVQDGAVVCPDAGEECTVDGAQGVCSIGRTSCVGGGTVCAAQFEATTEECDNLDNDCDGTVDDGDSLCSAGRVCANGVCVDACFEGSCAADQTCTEAGVCVETACIGVTCPAGSLCSGGTCVEGCAGVTCPLGQGCIAGRCVDSCATISCDPECEACDSGMCVARCTDTSCASGEVCNADGLCESELCGGGCPTGEVCTDTGCVDACLGVTCPAGEECVAGACTNIPEPDAAVSFPDASTGDVDAYVVDYFADAAGGIDAASTRPTTRSTGCGCSVPGGESNPTGLLAGLGALGLALVSRRRRR